MYKDEKLYYMANELGLNIAQFISIGPGMEIRYSLTKEPMEFMLKDSILKLIELSSYKMVNVRTFKDEDSKSLDFIYGKTKEDIDEIIDIIREKTSQGIYCIVNENIDINDGGVSGVMMVDTMEFAPQDTPRCVEKPGVCSIEIELGIYMLKRIYGIDFERILPYINEGRIEFSIHPNKQGIYDSNLIIWEYEELDDYIYAQKRITFDNRFSEFMGNKAYGLLMLWDRGFLVPQTLVIGRNLPPFTFGEPTHQTEKWIRTCPYQKISGKYYSGKGWQDPFKFMEEEDPNKEVVSILWQDHVEAEYSGAALITKPGQDNIIECVRGDGDKFMVGESKLDDLPTSIKGEIDKIGYRLQDTFSDEGTYSIEWVFDGESIWIVQFNEIDNISNQSGIIVDGCPETYVDYNVDKGLEGLRSLVDNIKDDSIGINLIGEVGITSHFGDILRINNIPSRIIY
jgi:hypothetical protein